MFAVQCPYCKHANRRGARFCADCGAPLHLKPCPKCGKVDDVTAKQCAACGMPFPPIELAEYAAEAEPATGQAPAGGMPRAAAPSYRAGPLIAIALVAGGLPLLWMYRNYLPLPKAWQSAPATPAARVGPPVAPPLGVPSAPAAKTQSVSAPAVENVPPAASPAGPPVVQAEAPAEPETKPKTTRKPSKPKTRPVAGAKPAGQDASEPRPTPRECTESLVALGLCERSQIRK